MAENKKKNYAMKVRNCTTTEQYSEFISEAKLVLVMFGAYRCQSSAIALPIFESTCRKYPEILFVKCDIEDLERLKNVVGVYVTPSFFLYRNGELVEQFDGTDMKKLDLNLLKYSNMTDIFNSKK